jgi:hypothetical protein
MELLTVANAKTVKGEPLGYLTGILYLSPANESQVRNVCPHASAGCKASCLYTAGRAQAFPMIQRARIRKTRLLVSDRPAFLVALRHDIEALSRRAENKGLRPAVRINGTSDIADIPHALALEYPGVQFYDYTKIPRPYLRVRDNYHLTFSLSENNGLAAKDALDHGVNVAAVFHVKRGHALPASYLGAPVLDGDKYDLRFLDGYKGSIIGLRAKGLARRDTSGFVRLPILSKGAL